MDEPILKTPGEILAEARDTAGLTLAQLAEITKIPVRQLESIERDEYHKLSGPLYVKSFLRAYADAVGVETAIVLDLYARSSGERRVAAPGAEVWSEDTVTISRVGLPWGRLGALGAAVALAVLVIWLLARALGGDGAPPQPSTPAVATAVPETSSTRAADPAPLPAAVPDAVPEEVPAAEPVVQSAADATTRHRDAAADSLARSYATTPAAGARRTGPGAQGPPRAASGADPGLVIGGRTWPLRLRLLTRSPLRMQVKSEGATEFLVTTVPRDGAALPPLPATGVEPGTLYAAREGLVAYWGAVEYFEFGLDRVAGVEITVNGEPCDVGDLAPDATKLLHARTILQPSSRR